MLSGIAQNDAQTLNPRVWYRGADFRTDASPSPRPNDGGYKRGKEILDHRNLNRLRNKCAMTRSAKEAGRKSAFTLAEVFSTHSAGRRKIAFTLAEVFSTLSAGYRKVAFTLAEVLITLGIIGVVAALTLPTLIQNYQEKATVTKVKKFYSIFSQAYMRAIVDNGPIDSWGLGNSEYNYDEEGNQTTITDETEERLDKFFKIMEPYLIKSGYEKIHSSSYGNENKGYRLADGTSIVGLWLNTTNCNSDPTVKCGDIYLKTDNKPSRREDNSYNPNTFLFDIYPERIKPVGGTAPYFKTYCLSGVNYAYCSAWVILYGNMDYLHCSDLSWDGKHECK